MHDALHTYTTYPGEPHMYMTHVLALVRYVSIPGLASILGDPLYLGWYPLIGLHEHQALFRNLPIASTHVSGLLMMIS